MTQCLLHSKLFKGVFPNAVTLTQRNAFTGASPATGLRPAKILVWRLGNAGSGRFPGLRVFVCALPSQLPSGVIEHSLAAHSCEDSQGLSSKNLTLFLIAFQN